ncbi:MAG: hypothetical protein AAF667_09435 [Pseudomonadota bacterium]
MSTQRSIGGSRYLYDSFTAASARIDANERLSELHFATIEARLDRIEKLIERLERRLWLTVYGVVAVILAQGAKSLIDLNAI